MTAPSAADLLAAWERGIGLAPAWRALILLSTESPGSTPEELALLSVGQRDSRLLALRQLIFGPRLVSLATCAGCGERLELAFHTAELLGDGPPPGHPPEISLQLADAQVVFRLPNSLDLLALDGLGDVQAARQVLLERCVLAVQSASGDASRGLLSEEIAGAVAQAMEQMEPQGNITTALTCPSCGLRWDAYLDIVTFFLDEMKAWIARLLGEVHTLASAYGWRESDILALNPWRRQMYLEMVNG